MNEGARGRISCHVLLMAVVEFRRAKVAESTAVESRHQWTCSTPVVLNWPERIKTQPHDDRDNCFLHFDSKGPCGMTVNNDINDDSATKHGDFHTRNSHRQSV